MFTSAWLLVYFDCLLYVSCSQGWDIFSFAHRDIAIVPSSRQKRKISQQLVLLLLSLNHDRVALLPKTVRQVRALASLDLDTLSRDFEGQLPSNVFWDFADARDYARSLNFTSQQQWKEWSASAKRPDYIPNDPYKTYKTKGWLSLADWLGYGKGQLPSNVFWDFADARDYARSLNFTLVTQWRKWSASGERPDHIPSAPYQTYKGKGWLSWADWLGYGRGRLPSNVFWDFADARDYARSLNFTGKKQWVEWSASGARPNYIPSDPYKTYKTSGWVSWPDWMGYAPRGIGGQVKSASFNVARDYARSLNFTSQAQWFEWCGNGSRPDGIPRAPSEAYKEKGWLSWADWLGYGKGHLPSNVFWDFVDARDYARSLNISSAKQWKEWSACAKRPDYIPFNPDKTYKMKGWLSWADWLGYGKGQLPSNVFWDFVDARDYARSLTLTSATQWKEWSASGSRPDYIPSNPDQTYKMKGWLSWFDWLGYGKGHISDVAKASK